MIRLQILTGTREQALPVFTNPQAHLFLTGRPAKIGGGTAYIMDISLELRVPDQQSGFSEQRGMAPCLDDSALVEREGTEVAAPETAPVAGERKPDFPDGRNAAFLFVGRMAGTHIGQIINIVHFLCGKGRLRRILHHIHPISIRFDQCPACKGIGVFVLDKETFRIPSPVLFYFIIGQQLNAVMYRRYVLCLVHGARNKTKVFY